MVPVRDTEQAFRGTAYVFVEFGNDETSATPRNGNLESILLDRADDQDEVVQVGHREQHVRTRSLDLVDQRAGVSQSGRIGLEHDNLDALTRRLLPQAVGCRCAERGVLEDHGDLRRIAYQFRHLQLRQRELRRARERGERIMTIYVELVRTRTGYQRHFRTFGDFACDQCQRAGKAAMNRGELVTAD